MLESAVLDLYEAEAAGIGQGDLEYHHVAVGPDDLVALTGRDAGVSEAFLLEAIREARGAARHWEDMLAGDVPTDGFPPVVVFRGDGPEIVDGEHRLAAMVLHPRERVGIVVGVEPGTALEDCMPSAAAWGILPEREAFGWAISPSF